ncbi:MAG: YdcF family protein [Nitrospira sp.]|nr:MAG: YdcF family protein [Nitrospira sp.]
MDLTPTWFGIYKASKYLLYPMSWIIFTAVATLLVASLPVTPRRTTWVRRLAFSTILLLFLTATPLVSHMSISLLEARYPPFTATPAQKFDAVVVLSGSVLQKGSLRPADEPGETSRQRTACGAELWQQGLAPKLFLTGGDATVIRNGPPISREMKRWALRLGVPESVIQLEEQSRTTYENAVQTKAILGPGRILLVTAAYHLPRAVGLFEKQGFTVIPVACGFEAKHHPRQAWEQKTLFDFIPTAQALLISTQTIDEVAGILVYWITGKWQP